VKVFGDLAPLQITFEVVLVAGAVSILAGIVMGLRSKADALLKAQADAEKARAILFNALATSGVSSLSQISNDMKSISAKLDKLLAPGAGQPNTGTTRVTSGDTVGAATTQSLDVAASEVGKLLTDTVKGTVGQIPKLDRGAQFVALGVILILVAAGVGMFVYAVRPVG
jgi:hypothetical protein